MSTPVPIPAPQPGDPGYRDHAEQMLARLPEQFRREGNNISKILLALADPVQQLDAACKQALHQLDLDNAVGVHLDVRGKIVDELRNGLDDDTYRRRIRARIAVHRSKGTIEDIIRVTRLVVFADSARIRVLPQRNTSVVVRVEDAVVSEAVADAVLFGFLTKTVAAGVRIVLESSTVLSAESFSFDDAAGLGLDGGSFIDARG